MTFTLAIAFLAGGAVGALICWALGQRRTAGLAAQLAGAAAALDAERRGSAEKLALIDQTEQKLRDAFKALSADALQHNSQAFLDLARSSLGEFQQKASSDFESRHRAFDELVKPLKDSLTRVDSKLEAVEKERVGAYAAIDERLKAIASVEQRLHSETSMLVRALRSPNVRGQWGEMQLRRVVEAAGMVEHCDFEVKKSAATEDGRLTPDLLVRLPGGKNVIVDSKVPASAYLEALELTDEAARDARMKEHARQVREHVTKLADKSYWRQFQPTPELVVMFVPGETLLYGALQQDPSLIEYGLTRNVVLASPMSLLVILRAVAHGWQQERIAENAQAICEEGRRLFDRIRAIADHFEKLGKRLGGAVEAYNDAVGSLESRMLVSARKLKDLGVTADPDPEVLPPVDVRARAFQTPELRDLLSAAEPEAIDAEVAEPIT